MARPLLAQITPTTPHCPHFGEDLDEVAAAATSLIEGALVEADDLWMIEQTFSVVSVVRRRVLVEIFHVTAEMLSVATTGDLNVARMRDGLNGLTESANGREKSIDQEESRRLADWNHECRPSPSPRAQHTRRHKRCRSIQSG